jgi:WD repeat-containing protein 35
MEDIANLEKLI